MIQEIKPGRIKWRLRIVPAPDRVTDGASKTGHFVRRQRYSPHQRNNNQSDNGAQRNCGDNDCINKSAVPRNLDRENVGLVVSGGPQLAIVCIDEPGGKTLVEIAPIVAAAAARARDGALIASDVAPCAVSVSNLGMYDVDEFLAIIDPDQCAMISVGRIHDQVVAVDGTAVVRPMMSVTIAADHRVVDGTDAAQFLQDLKRGLEST